MIIPTDQPPKIDKIRPTYLAEKLSISAKINSPTRGRIKVGNVAQLRSKFDKNGKRDGSKTEPDVLKLRKSALKPSSPGQMKKKRTGMGSVRKRVIDPKQSLILDYYRGQEASEMGSTVSLDDDS